MHSLQGGALHCTALALLPVGLECWPKHTLQTPQYGVHSVESIVHSVESTVWTPLSTLGFHGSHVRILSPLDLCIQQCSAVQCSAVQCRAVNPLDLKD
jgi:hypothetical protein